MINETQHLLVCLMEECAEVQKECAKALRFGLDDKHPKYEGSNKERMEQEVIDLMGVLEMLFARKIIMLPDDFQARIKDKQRRIQKYMDYARERGVLE